MSELGYLKILLSGATLFAPLDVNSISSTHVIHQPILTPSHHSYLLLGPFMSFQLFSGTKAREFEENQQSYSENS